MYNHQIYQLRQVEMDPKVAAKLWPFINAYRPHDSVQSWRELRAEGYEPVEKDSALDERNDHYFTLTGHYPEDEA
jgi:hypothetical protein